MTFASRTLVGAFSVIVQPVVEPMDRFSPLVFTFKFLRVADEFKVIKIVPPWRRDLYGFSADSWPLPATVLAAWLETGAHNELSAKFS